MASEDQDKTEEPTHYRLEEARRRGEVAKSADAVGTAILIAFAATFAMAASGLMLAFAEATRSMLLMSGRLPDLGPGLVAWMEVTYFPVWQALMPVVLALIVVAVLANAFQTGPVFSSHPISPDFKRLDPAQTVKRLFSLRTVWELGKMLLKVILLSALAWVIYGRLQPWVASVAGTAPERLPGVAWSGFVWLSVYVLVILGLMSLLDLLMTRREFLRKMRTSRRELRDEIKKRDGDPEVKGKQKQLIRELLRKARSVPKAAEADVILINPTHYAVALQYRPATMRAPIVLTKGAGFLSRRIREVGQRHGVPTLRSPAVARARYRDVAINDPVSEKLYARLAPVYRWLFSRRRPAGAVA